MKYAIDEQSMTDIADAVRYRTGTFEPMDVPAMVAKMKEKYMVNCDVDMMVPDENEQPWTRPADWPDLDSLNLDFTGDTDFIYITYRCDLEYTSLQWYIEPYSGQTFNYSSGTIQNGVFVPGYTSENFTTGSTIAFSVNSYKNLQDLDYIVIRIIGKIKKAYMVNVSSTSSGRYYDAQKSPMIERIAYIPNVVQISGNSASNYFWGSYYLEHDKVVNGNGNNLTTIGYAWANCVRLQSLEIDKLYIPNVTSLASVFSRCFILGGELDLRHWDVSKVTNMASTFLYCNKLKSVDLTGWNTSNTTSMSYMFQYCKSLRQIKGIDGFNTSKVSGMLAMFQDCHSLLELPIQNFDTSKITSMSSMFSGCFDLSELDVSNWDVGKVINLASTFSNCRSLIRLDLSKWSTGNVTTTSGVFANCYNLQNIDIHGIHVTNVCTSIGSMFSGCWSLKRIDIPITWDVSGVSNSNYTFYQIFYNCYSLEVITGIRDWQINTTNSASGMFCNCFSLKELDVSGWKVNTINNFSSMFYSCTSLESLDLSNWNIQNTTTLASMFAYCYSLKSIGDISGWDVSKCTSFATMFLSCRSLRSMPDISGWDMSKATTCQSMFNECMEIKEIELKNLNLAECTRIDTMFRYCYNLRKVDFTGWSIPKVTTTAPGGFLSECYSLEDVKVFSISLNHSYASDYCLTHESLINILNSLPQVSTTRTLNLSTVNLNRLSPEEKQIATDKGWTLAA